MTPCAVPIDSELACFGEVPCSPSTVRKLNSTVGPTTLALPGYYRIGDSREAPCRIQWDTLSSVRRRMPCHRSTCMSLNAPRFVWLPWTRCKRVSPRARGSSAWLSLQSCLRESSASGSQPERQPATNPRHGNTNQGMSRDRQLGDKHRERESRFRDVALLAARCQILRAVPPWNAPRINVVKLRHLEHLSVGGVPDSVGGSESCSAVAARESVPRMDSQPC